MVNFNRRPNIFEGVLLIIGLVLIVLGYVVIYRVFITEGFLSWNLLQTLFLWILMILLVILAAVNENMKEELKIVIENQAEEMRLLRRDLSGKKIR